MASAPEAATNFFGTPATEEQIHLRRLRLGAASLVKGLWGVLCDIFTD